MAEKIIAFRVSKEAYRLIKMKLAANGATVQQMGMTLFMNWLNKDEDRPPKVKGHRGGAET
jgi:hypothetical protein